jgi:hypothetical protein
VARAGYESDLTTKSDHNNMRSETVWSYTWIGRFPRSATVSDTLVVPYKRGIKPS